MKVTFVSNYINHHQIPVSNRLYERLGDDYRFIQTEPIEQERLDMGWEDKRGQIPYLICMEDDRALCEKLILDSDLVIYGGTDEESYLQPRLRSGKLIFRYSERLYKTGQWKAVSPRGLIKKYKDHTRYRNSPVYLLCAGGYVPSDFGIVRAYPDKMLKWGYFPEKKEYELQQLMEKKELGRMLWAGRFIDWKHPEMAITLAASLKENGFPFHLNMVGGGEMQKTLELMVEALDLREEVSFLGYLSPEEVRREMEKSEIYLFTSDRQEGWGAVLNEAMNSGCAVVASHEIGAVPFLIRPGINGMSFKSGSEADLIWQTEKLLQSGMRSRRIGQAAYYTIQKLWNAQLAADRMLNIAQALLAGEEPEVYGEGPCSKAEIISEKDMAKRLLR